MAPELRLKSGDRVNVSVQNGLDAETTLHWHGIRIRNDMDGAAPTTQAPIGAGSSFEYNFIAPDPGTYWYHSHSAITSRSGAVRRLDRREPERHHRGRRRCRSGARRLARRIGYHPGFRPDGPEPGNFGRARRTRQWGNNSGGTLGSRHVRRATVGERRTRFFRTTRRDDSTHRVSTALDQRAAAQRSCCRHCSARFDPATANHQRSGRNSVSVRCGRSRDDNCRYRWLRRGTNSCRHHHRRNGAALTTCW